MQNTTLESLLGNPGGQETFAPPEGGGLLETLKHAYTSASAPVSSNERAEMILTSLKYGYSLGEECCPPRTLAGVWGLVTVVEAETDGVPSAFHRLVSSLAGLETQFEIVINAEADGLSVWLGMHNEALFRRAASILAPGSLLRREPIRGWMYPHVVGVTHRVQEKDMKDAGVAGRTRSVLAKVDSLVGRWSIFIQCESAYLPEILRTRHRVDILAQEAEDNLSLTWQTSSSTSDSRSDGTGDSPEHSRSSRSKTKTSGTSSSESTSVTVTSKPWTRVKDWLATIDGVMTDGAAEGLWKVNMWATAENQEVSDLVSGALHATVPCTGGRRYESLSRSHVHDDGAVPTSVLTSSELGGILAPPSSSTPGLVVREAPPQNRRPCRGEKAVPLGHYAGTELVCSFNLDDLEGHGFVTGTTGSGKSTTLHRILAESWNRHQVPFLVLDPVKDDYSEVAPYFEGGIQVVRGSDVKMNILEPWPGESHIDHVAAVADAFRGAFTMPSPIPYVIVQLFDRVASMHREGSDLSLFDVRDAAADLISSLGYAPELHSNIKAAVMTRLNLLLSPARAHRFCWPDSAMVHALFDRPTVVSFSDIRDEEERSFLILLLTQAAWSFAKSRQRDRAVEHILVLEEAHRIIPEVDDRAISAEGGSAKQTSAQMLSSMMAEVRSYGQQILVVDQSPSKVSSDVSRNTNLKVAHRVVHPEDQGIVAGMLGLDPDQSGLFGELERGCAVYSTRTEPGAQTVSVRRLLPDELVSDGDNVTKLDGSATTWPCCKDNPAEHFRAWQRGSDTGKAMSLFLAGVMWGNGDGAALRQRVEWELRQLQRETRSPVNCLTWSGLRQLTSPRRMEGPSHGPESAAHLLDTLYQFWNSGAPITNAAATTSGVPDVAAPDTTHQRWPTVLDNKTALHWEERALAAALLESAPKNTLWALKPDRISKEDYSNAVLYLREYLAAVTPLLGTGAVPLVRAYVHGAFNTLNLSPAKADRYLQQAIGNADTTG